MGVMFDNGEGVPEDDTEAVKWYRKAAKQGYTVAQARLAAMYLSGEGVPQDHSEAAIWFRRAAEHGHTRAQTILGFMYEQGWGLPEDDVRAYAWFNIAAAQGDNEIAKEGKERIAQSLTRERRGHAQRLARQFWEAYVLPFQN